MPKVESGTEEDHKPVVGDGVSELQDPLKLDIKPEPSLQAVNIKEEFEEFTIVEHDVQDCEL